MEKCVFIDIFTTMNDLAGSHNCPIQFRCEVGDFERVSTGGVFMTKQIDMLPDEPILGNGTAFHGFTDDILKSYATTKDQTHVKWEGLDSGLGKIRVILETLSKSGVFLVGYGMKGYVLKVLNEHFSRVLGMEPLVFDSNRVIDVEMLAKLLVDVRKCGNYCKRSVISTLNLGIDHTHTDIAQEISSTRTLLAELMRSGGLHTLGETADFLNAPHFVEYFQMGKYKGQKIDDVFKTDRWYFSWILKNREFYENDPDLLRRISDIMSAEDK